jgi:O-antigen/teichoic acid export membrane protein
MKKLWGDIARTSGANIFAAIISLVVLRLTSQTLGPTGRGTYAALTGWVALFGAFGSLSIGQVFMHHVANRPKDSWIDETTGTIFGIVATLTGMCWTVVVILYIVTAGNIFHTTSYAALSIAFLALPFVITFDVGRYFLYALDRIRVYNIAQLCGYTLQVVLLSLLVASGWITVGNAMVAYVLLYVTMATIASISITRHTHQPRSYYRGACGCI